MIVAIISAAGVGPIAVWIALGLALGFALHSARTHHDDAHHRTGSGRKAA